MFLFLRPNEPLTLRYHSPIPDLHHRKEDHHLHSHGVQMCGLRIRSERVQDGTTNQTSQGNERLNDASCISRFSPLFTIAIEVKQINIANLASALITLTSSSSLSNPICRYSPYAILTLQVCRWVTECVEKQYEVSVCKMEKVKKTIKVAVCSTVCGGCQNTCC